MVSRAVQRKILDDNEMQNFKRSKLEMFFGRDERKPDLRLRSQAKGYAVFREKLLSKTAKQKNGPHLQN